MADKPIALVVEDDELQRASVAVLLEGTDMDVFQCESGEAAELILEEVGGALCFMFTDVNLAGSMTGAELADIAASRYPQVRVVVSSGRNPPPLPNGTTFMSKPWNSLDLLREANEARHH
jgi:two-component system, cell cycle response regulator CpdR